MSERSNIPGSKGTGEKLTLAIIGLVGVLMGSLISIGSNYFLAVRAERTAQENAQRTRNAEMKVAARLVSDQLAAVAAGAQMLSEEKKLSEKALRFPLDAWDQNKAVLARDMDDDSFSAVRVAVFRAEAFRTYRDAALSEIPRDRSADGRSFFADIKRGLDALRPYMSEQTLMPHHADKKQ
jgi:hypothetical protein